MPRSLDFILGLLDQRFPAFVAHEDFAGEHGSALRLWQRRGFLSREPERHPVPSCPYCGDGVPYPLGERALCSLCFSTVDPRHLLLWRFDLGALLEWLAAGLNLNGGVRQVGDRLWQMGNFRQGGVLTECFFVRNGRLSDSERTRLLAYRNALVLPAVPQKERIDGFRGRALLLLELLSLDRRSLKVRDLQQLLQTRGNVRFEVATGSLFVGDAFLGEVIPGSREHALLQTLAHEQNAFVSYADLKRAVLGRTGSTDSTDEATFCQKLKSRLKRAVPQTDRLIATTGKGDGYRLRSYAAW